MKNILNYLKNFIIIVYILLIIFVTICLLSYNDFKITVLGNTTLLPVIDEDLEKDFNKGDLLLIERNRLTSLKEGDEVFFYRKRFGETIVNYAVIKGIDRVSESEFTYTIEGDYKFSSSNFIGKVDTTTVVPKVGMVLSILESKWGFLFLGVFPSLVAFFFTLYSVIQEGTAGDEEDDEEQKPKKKSKKSKKAVEEKKEKKAEEKIEEVKEETKEPEPVKENNPVREEKKEETVVVEEKQEEKTEEKIEEVKEEIKEENPVQENEGNTKVEETKEDVKEEKETAKAEEKIASAEEELQKKKAAIEAKMKSMTEEEKKALIKAKLDSMTEEEKRALIEAKKKKLEAEKNNKGDQ